MVGMGPQTTEDTGPMAREALKYKPQASPDLPKVSVILVAFQSGEHLKPCLDALAAQTFQPLEILLIDNASTDGAPAAALLDHPTVRLVEPGCNLGFAAGVNLGADLAQGDWLALINPDAFAQADWLETLIAATRTWPDIVCFGSRQLMANAPGKLDGLGDVMSLPGFPFRGGYGRPDPGPTAPGETFSACGGAMLIRRDIFQDMGGFDARLFCYCEDVDLGYRLRLENRPTLVIPDAVVRHVGSASTGGPRSEFASFHGARNRFWVFVKDTPPLLFWLTLPLHLALTAILFVRLAQQGHLAPQWRGLMAGIKGLPLALEARREAQARRRVGSWAIARAMTWNPLDLLQRRVVIRKP